MLFYITNYWPCVRYIDNVSKIINELSFSAMIVQCIYLKEMANSVDNYSIKGVTPLNTGWVMIGVMGGNLLYHTTRLIVNTGEATVTAYKRRKQIASKILGPPVKNDPLYSDESSSGDEDPKKPPPQDPDLDLILPAFINDLPGPVRVVYPLKNGEEEFCKWMGDNDKFDPGAGGGDAVQAWADFDKKFDAEAKDKKRAEFDRLFEKNELKLVLPIDFVKKELMPLKPIIPEEPPKPVAAVVPDCDITWPSFVVITEPLKAPEIGDLKKESWPEALEIDFTPVCPGMEESLIVPKLPASGPADPLIGPQDSDTTGGQENVIDFPTDPAVDKLPSIPNDKSEQPPADLDIPLTRPILVKIILPTFQFDVDCLPTKVNDRMCLKPKIKPKRLSKMGATPKALKPKEFHKVPNTIPMPMRIKNVPFKPVGIKMPEPMRKPSPPKLRPQQVRTPGLEDSG